MKKSWIVMVCLLTAWPGMSYAAPMGTLRWRWGSGSVSHAPARTPRTRGALFESDKKWGAKEWLIIGGGVVLAVGIGVAIASSSNGGSGSSGGY